MLQPQINSCTSLGLGKSVLATQRKVTRHTARLFVITRTAFARHLFEIRAAQTLASGSYDNSYCQFCGGSNCSAWYTVSAGALRSIERAPCPEHEEDDADDDRKGHVFPQKRL